MTIFDWLEKVGQTDSWLAVQLGLSRPAVSGYRTGKTIPRLEHAVKIHKLSKGEVSYEEMAGVLINRIDKTVKNELEDL